MPIPLASTQAFELPLCLQNIRRPKLLTAVLLYRACVPGWGLSNSQPQPNDVLNRTRYTHRCRCGQHSVAHSFATAPVTKPMHDVV